MTEKPRIKHSDLFHLLEISKKITSTLESSEILKSIIENAVRLTYSDSGSIILINKDTGTLDIEAAVNINDEDYKKMKLNFGQGITGWTAENGKPARVGNVLNDHRYIEIKNGIMSELAVPIIIRNRVIGVINLDSNLKYKYSEYDEDLIVMLAGLSAQVIDNSRLFYEIKQKNEELDSLIDISKSIVSSLYLDEVVLKIVENIIPIVEADISSIHLLNDKKDKLILMTSSGEKSRSTKIRTVPVDKSLIGIVVKSQKPLYIEDVQTDERYFYKDFAKKEKLHSLIAVPLQIENRSPLGVLSIYSKKLRAFSDTDVEFILSFAAFATIAIENAMLLKKNIEAEEKIMREKHLSDIGKMASGLAHEIRNPLASMKGAAQLLKNKIDKKYYEYIDVIIEESDRLSYLIELILDYTRKPVINLTETRIDNVIDSVENHLKNIITEKNINIIKENLDNIIHTDERLFKSIVLNIIKNAVEASGQGRSIKIEYKEKELNIYDQAPKLSEKEINKIFDAFYTTKEMGIGLGLSISKKFAEALDAEIKVGDTPRQKDIFNKVWTIKINGKTA